MEITFLAIMIGFIIGFILIPYLQNIYWNSKYGNINIEEYIEEIVEYKNGFRYINVGNLHPYLADKIIKHLNQQIKKAP